jgi:5-methylcytosine-specific restriction enzyme subunit McrC
VSRTFEAFEHDTIRVSSEGGIAETDFNALVRFNDAHSRRFFDVGHRRIKLRSFVGYLQVGDLAIEILPKADRGPASSPKVWRARLLEMLGVALGLRIEHAPAASQKIARFQLLDLIALGYLAELEPLVHHGLSKGYRSTEANGAVFRGRLKIAEHIRANAARADRFFVEYQTYDHDITANRLLAAALHALDGCALSPHVASRVNACITRFPEVRHAGVTRELFERIRLTRATQRYQAALVYARMILEHQGPQLQAGPRQVFALLFDMNVLWERYVAALFRRAAIPGVAVTTQERHLFWSSTEQARRRVRPDVVVRVVSADGRGQPLLVIDTKWKVPARGHVSDDDLKQMFVYNELLPGARSVLLYPATADSAAVRGTYAGKRHTCEQLYLGPPGEQDWGMTTMCAQLRSLLEAARDAARS